MSIYQLEIQVSPTSPTCNHTARRFDILLTRHEDKNISRWTSQVNLEHLLDGAVDVILTRRLAMEYLDRESSARNGEVRGLTEEVRKLRVRGINNGTMYPPVDAYRPSQHSSWRM